MQLHCSSLSSILLSGCKQVKLQAGSSFINIEITRAGTLLSAVLCNSLIYNPDYRSHMPRNLKTEAKTVYPRCPWRRNVKTHASSNMLEAAQHLHTISQHPSSPLFTQSSAVVLLWLRSAPHECGWDQTWSFRLCFMVRTDAVVTSENMMCRPLVSGEALRPAPYPCVHRWSLVFV